jgi:hypothetical protein
MAYKWAALRVGLLAVLMAAWMVVLKVDQMVVETADLRVAEMVGM